MARRRVNTQGASPADRLEYAVGRVLDVVKKARKYRMSLSGANFYADKLAELRADATNAFNDLSAQSVGDTSAMAEMIEVVFSTVGKPNERVRASRELLFSLKTTWRDSRLTSVAEGGGLFPLGVLTQANRGYLTVIGRQMNGCYASGWYDAAAVMMRRLLEIAMIEAFENKGVAPKIKDDSGNYVQLTDLIGAAVNEPSFSLSRNCRKYLPQLRDVGHMSAHGRYFQARKDDVDRLRQGCRIVVEEFLHHAGLL